MTPAKQASAEIYAALKGRVAQGSIARSIMEPIIQRAILQEVAPLQAVIDARGIEITRLLSSQRPYVEWIMDDAHHADSCAFTDWVEEKPGVFVHPDNHPNLRLHCTCGLQKLRDELRKQVGGE